MVTSDLFKDYRERVLPALKEKRGYKNINEVPKITKVVLNCCVGSAQDIKAALEDAQRDMALITGQKTAKTRSKKSISNFKLRKQQEIGCKVTLRGKMMYDFLLRFMFMALPRIRDFRGVSVKAFDGRGAYTLGIKDHTIFPEIELDKIKRTLGMDVTIVTTARSKDETRELLALLGMPFVIRSGAVKAQAKAEEK
ncbi:MAG: 50S ribosomal protein L5 [Verrucomicrobiota bacterium]